MKLSLDIISSGPLISLNEIKGSSGLTAPVPTKASCLTIGVFSGIEALKKDIQVLIISASTKTPLNLPFPLGEN